MSKKSPKIAQMLENVDADGVDPHYAGYFYCFNQGLFYEAHDVLEELWLTDRLGPDGNYFKGLIQFAGAFVHLQKQRLKPAIALFLLARKNLTLYPNPHHRLDLAHVLGMIDRWMKSTHALIEKGGLMPPPEPKLQLLPRP